MTQKTLAYYLSLILVIISNFTFAINKRYFISHSGKQFTIEITDTDLNTDETVLIDFSKLKGSFNHQIYNQSYQAEQVQVDGANNRVYFNLSDFENDTSQQYLYCYHIDIDSFELIQHIKNERLRWWNLFPDENFIVAYGEEEFSFLYIDLDSKEIYDIIYAQDSLHFIDARITENILELVGKEGSHFLKWSYNIDDDLVIRDSLFALEFDSASLIYNHPFLLEANYKKEYVLLHTANKIYEIKLKYKGRKLWIDENTGQILLPTKSGIHSYDFQLNLIDSVGIENGTIFCTNNDAFFIKEIRDVYGENEFYYWVSKDFQHNYMIDGKIVPENLISVQEYSKEDTE